MVRPRSSAMKSTTRPTRCWAHGPMGRRFQMQASNLGAKSFFCLVAAVFCLAPQVGCGRTKGGPATVEVTGSVTLNGSPVDGASVLFSPDIGSSDGRLASQATTDAQGR